MAPFAPLIHRFPLFCSDCLVEDLVAVAIIITVLITVNLTHSMCIQLSKCDDFTYSPELPGLPILHDTFNYKPL